jgi:hypothetical protein
MLQLIGLFTEEPHSPIMFANRAQLSLTKGPVKFARLAKEAEPWQGVGAEIRNPRLKRHQ